MSQKRFRSFLGAALVSLLLAFMAISHAWARAGGAGGGRSGGRSGGSSHSSGSYRGSTYSGGYGDSSPCLYSPFISAPGLIVTVIVVVIVWGFLKKRLPSNAAGPSQSQDEGSYEGAAFESPLDEAQLDDFKRKAATAFLTIQSEWSQKSVKGMRRFITDGVYQRFHAQFTMMNLLGQSNTLQDVKILGMNPVRYAQDGAYECMDVQILAQAFDQFISPDYPEFNSPGGTEQFVEFWSFVRRMDLAKSADIYHETKCPQCSAPLDDKLMESARCPYCSAYLNSGEFDWVLSEIIQKEHYRGFDYESPTLQAQLRALRARKPDFAMQWLKDRASNAFLQIQIARAQHAVKSLQRFSTPQFYERESAALSQNYVYARLFIDSVECVALHAVDSDLYRAHLEINCSFQRLASQPGSSKFTEMDSEIVTQKFTLQLIHQISDQKAQGSIYANACSSCGATQKDSLNVQCTFCDAVLNDPRGDWIVDALE